MDQSKNLNEMTVSELVSEASRLSFAIESLRWRGQGGTRREIGLCERLDAIKSESERRDSVPAPTG